MRSLFLAALLALSAALVITGLYRPKPLEEQLIHLQVERAMPQYADALAGEPADLQALFLAYADDPILLAKARIALLRYPEIARPVLLQYGDRPTFQDVLRRYGEDVVLPVHYFVTQEIFTLELMRSFSDTASAAFNVARELWSGSSSSQSQVQGPLTSEQRGQYAIYFIDAEGYDFLGQFVVNAKGEVGWVQTERVLEGLNRFFAGGMKALESKYRRDEEILLGDVGSAALDVAVGVSAFKILRMGRAGAAGAAGADSLTFSQRSAALGAGLWRGTAVGARVVKYGAPAVLAYMAVRHPSIINSLLGQAAERLGLPVRLVQIVGWTLVLLPVMLVLRLLFAPTASILSGIASLLRWGVGSRQRRALS